MSVFNEILQLDQAGFLLLNGLGNSKWDGFWVDMTHLQTWIPTYIIIALLMYHLWGWEKATIALIFIGLMILCTDQMTNWIKYTVKRDRPCWDPDIGAQVRLAQGFCGGPYGFFSAHAANHFALALFLGKILRTYAHYVPFLLLLWASVVAYSRVYVGVHYPLDIISGALFGLCIGFIFNKLHNEFSLTFLSQNYPSS